jgi:hypothetical protein
MHSNAGASGLSPKPLISAARAFPAATSAVIGKRLGTACCLREDTIGERGVSIIPASAVDGTERLCPDDRGHDSNRMNCGPDLLVGEVLASQQFHRRKDWISAANGASLSPCR